jgi:hypothetical protein
MVLPVPAVRRSGCARPGLPRRPAMFPPAPVHEAADPCPCTSPCLVQQPITDALFPAASHNFRRSSGSLLSILSPGRASSATLASMASFRRVAPRSSPLSAQCAHPWSPSSRFRRARAIPLGEGPVLGLPAVQVCAEYLRAAPLCGLLKDSGVPVPAELGLCRLGQPAGSDMPARPAASRAAWSSSEARETLILIVTPSIVRRASPPA